MTKSLTELWKDGELPEGTYYVMFLCGRYGTYEFERLKGFGFDNDLAYIKEVLAPVPSYDEYKELKTKCHQLEKELVLNKLEPIHLHNCLARISELEEKNKNARKKIKKLKEQLSSITLQLKEANKLILSCKGSVKSIYAGSIAYGYYWVESDSKDINTRINKYLRKWGVK